MLSMLCSMHIQLYCSEFKADVHKHSTSERMEETASNHSDGYNTSNHPSEELAKPNAEK